MKKYTILFFIFIYTLNLSSNELSWVDEKVNAIQPSREGLSNYEISKLQDPFISYTGKNSIKNTKRYREPLKPKLLKQSQQNKDECVQIEGYILDAIMNKSAFINGKWYKLNDKIGKYKLSKVSSSSVVLTYNKKSLVLTISTKNKKFKL